MNWVNFLNWVNKGKGDAIYHEYGAHEFSRMRVFITYLANFIPTILKKQHTVSQLKYVKIYHPFIGSFGLNHLSWLWISTIDTCWNLCNEAERETHSVLWKVKCLWLEVERKQKTGIEKRNAGPRKIK
jgi:hypothetical protein